MYLVIIAGNMNSLQYYANRQGNPAYAVPLQQKIVAVPAEKSVLQQFFALLKRIVCGCAHIEEPQKKKQKKGTEDEWADEDWKHIDQLNIAGCQKKEILYQLKATGVKMDYIEKRVCALQIV